MCTCVDSPPVYCGEFTPFVCLDPFGTFCTTSDDAVVAEDDDLSACTEHFIGNGWCTAENNNAACGKS